MTVSWQRLAFVAVHAEILPVIVLFGSVWALSTGSLPKDQALAEALGQILGPIVGFFAVLGGAIFLSRSVTRGHVGNGLLLGALVAALDITIFVMSGEPITPLLLASNVGRIVAGALGGWIARRRRIA